MKKKREKEKTISEVIRKVATWRRLYTGILLNEMELVRYTLEGAAYKVGMSKKSLDDFLLQLRLGRKYGFDFKKNSDELVGVLRNYIRERRTEE